MVQLQAYHIVIENQPRTVHTRGRILNRNVEIRPFLHEHGMKIVKVAENVLQFVIKA